MNKKEEVLIYGWFGHENLGDELILKSIIDLIKQSKKDIKINVMGSKPKNIERYHSELNIVSTYVDINIKSIMRTLKYNPFKVIRNLLLSDYLVIGSGGALSDWNPASTKTLFFLINFFAKVRKKPIIMLGVGAGPIIKEESKIKFKQVLEQVDYITLRDNESYQLLKSIGLKNVHLTNDVVYELKEDLSKISMKNNLERNNIGIVIAPLLLNSEEKKLNYKNEIIKYIKKVKELGGNPTLIPFQYEYDINLLDEIKESVEIEICTIGKDNMWKIIDEFKKQDIIVGMRFHSVVLSIILNIPVIPIIYHEKVYSAVKEFELEGIAQSIGDGSNWRESNIDADKMILDTFNIINNIENEKDRIRKILANKKNTNKKILKKYLSIY